MEITIKVPVKIVKVFRKHFKEITGRDCTADEIEKFIKADMREMYFNDDFEYNLNDALTSVYDRMR